MVRNVSEDTETSSLADGVKEIQIEDDDLRQSADTSALPLSDHCDAKDKKVCLACALSFDLSLTLFSNLFDSVQSTW